MKHLQRKIKWVEGKPLPVDTEILNKEALKALPMTTLSLQYERSELEKEMGIDEDLEGLTNAEVMFKRLTASAARGDQRAVDMLLDRIIGKPKITTENKNFNVSYQEYLESLVELDLDDNGKE